MAIESAGVPRVEPGGRGYGGHAHGFAGQGESKRKKLQALVNAIDKHDLVAASHFFAALMNLEPELKDDAQWRALGHALDQGELYVAQHFMKALQTRFSELLSHAGHILAPHGATPSPWVDPEHGLCVNVQV